VAGEGSDWMKAYSCAVKHLGSRVFALKRKYQCTTYGQPPAQDRNMNPTYVQLKSDKTAQFDGVITLLSCAYCE
jgi:hypothetical protein